MYYCFIIIIHMPFGIDQLIIFYLVIIYQNSVDHCDALFSKVIMFKHIL